MGEIRFAGTGETREYPYLVCKKIESNMSAENDPRTFFGLVKSQRN